MSVSAAATQKAPPSHAMKERNERAMGNSMKKGGKALTGLWEGGKEKKKKVKVQGGFLIALTTTIFGFSGNKPRRNSSSKVPNEKKRGGGWGWLRGK